METNEKNNIKKTIMDQLEQCRNQELESTKLLETATSTAQRLMYDACRQKAAGGVECCVAILERIGITTMAELLAAGKI